MRLEEKIAKVAQRLDEPGAEGDRRDELAIHHVEVQHLSAADHDLRHLRAHVSMWKTEH